MSKVLARILIALSIMSVLSCENNQSTSRLKELSFKLESKGDSLKLYKDSLNRILHKYYIFKHVWTPINKVTENESSITYQFNLCGDGLLMDDSVVFSTINMPAPLPGVHIYKKNFRNYIDIEKSIEQDSIPIILNYYYSEKFHLHFPLVY